MSDEEDQWKVEDDKPKERTTKWFFTGLFVLFGIAIIGGLIIDPDTLTDTPTCPGSGLSNYIRETTHKNAETDAQTMREAGWSNITMRQDDYGGIYLEGWCSP